MRSNIKVEQGGWINSIHSKVTVIGLGLSLSALAFALGAPTTTRIFSGSEVAADSLPPAQPFALPSVVTSSDPTNPLLSACQLAGTAPYTVNVNTSYNLASCFNAHPSGQALAFSSSTCNGLSSDGALAPTTQISSCVISAQVPASGNSLASPPAILDLTIAGPLQSQTIAFASGSDPVPDATSPLYNGGSYTISLSGSSSDVEYEINPLDASNCTAQVTGSDVVVTSSISSGTGSCRISVFAERDPLNELDQSNTLERNLAVSALIGQPANLAINVPGTNDVFVGGSPTSALTLQNQEGTGAITWSVSSASSGVCSIDPGTGVITPGSTAGNCEVIADIAATSQYASHQIGPIQFPVNQYAGPTVVAGSFTAQSATKLTSFSLDVSSNFEYSNENGSVSYSLVSPAPAWLSIDADGVLSGTPSVNDEGGAIQIQVDDGLGLTSSVATASFQLSVNDLPSNRWASFGTASADYQIAAWSYPTTVTFTNRGPDTPNGRMAFLYTSGTNQNTAANRRPLSDVLTALNATDLTDGSYNANGLTDNNGNLLTVAVNGSDTAGYLVVGVGTRTGASGWVHGLLQLEPLGALSGGTTSTLSGAANQGFHLPSAYYGIDSNSNAIVFSDPAFSSDNTGIDALTLSGSAPTVLDSAPPGPLRLVAEITNTVTNERLSQQITLDDDGNFSVTFGPSSNNMLDNVPYTAVITATQGTASSSASRTLAGPVNLSNRLPTGQVTVTSNYRGYFGRPFGDLDMYKYRVGATLSADVTAVSDVEGIGTFEYQWTRDGTDISGATSSTYTLATEDAGQPVALRVWHTDAAGVRQAVELNSVWQTGKRIGGSTPWDLWQNHILGSSPQRGLRYLIATDDAWGGGRVEGPLPQGHSCDIQVRFDPMDSDPLASTTRGVDLTAVENPADGSFYAIWLPGQLRAGVQYKLSAACQNGSSGLRATDAASSLVHHHYLDEQDGDMRAAVTRVPEGLKVKLNNGPEIAYNYARVPTAASADRDGNTTVLDSGVSLRTMNCTSDYRYRISVKGGTPDRNGDYILYIEPDNRGSTNTVRGDSSTRVSYLSIHNSTPRAGTSASDYRTAGEFRTVVTVDGDWTHYDFDIFLAKGVTEAEGYPINLKILDYFGDTDTRRPARTGFETTFYVNNNAESCWDLGRGNYFQSTTVTDYFTSQTYTGRWFP